MSRLTHPLGAALRTLRVAMGNEGVRRLEVSWMLGLGADVALTVVLLVVVYAEGGVVATGLLGAVRMLPAVVSGMLAGSIVERFRGARVLVALGLIRAVSAAACGLVIALGWPLPWLFGLAAVAAAAAAPIRPIQATLMPALARSPQELVAANTAWSTGEGIGAMLGPLVAGLFVAAGAPALGAFAAGLVFLATAAVSAGLRFEQALDATGGGRPSGGGLRLVEGIRTLRRRPVPGWTMLGVFSQVMTRGLLTSLTVVASIELLHLGDAGVGLLNGALGLGGFLGAIFALSLSRSDKLIRTQAVALAYWGAPIAVIGLVTSPIVAVAAMATIGIANAVYDVSIFTIFQRGCSNEERAPVFSVFEGVAGLGAVSGSLLAPVLLAAFDARTGMAVAGSILPIVALVIYSRIGRTDRMTVVDEPMLDLLREVPVFSELPLTAIERLVAGVVPITFDAGAVLMREGEPGDRFLVIERGEVDVAIGGRFVQRLGRGAGVGEIALLRRSLRTATVTAVSDVAALSIDAATFLAAISGPAAAAATERFAAANVVRGETATAASAVR